MAIDESNPTELGNKLIVALRSVNDPQALMQAISDRSSNTLRGEIGARLDAIGDRIDAMDRATGLWHDDLVRVPTDVQKSANSLQELLGQTIQRFIADLRGEVWRALEQVSGKTVTLSEVSNERFASIQTQFLLLKEATGQLDLANKTAIAAALQAQKESAAETQKSSEKAIVKNETSTAEQIKALTNTFNTVITAQDTRINDLKARLDRGEGSTSISDPETKLKLEMTMSRLDAVSARANQNYDTRQSRGEMGSQIVSLVVMSFIGFGVIVDVILHFAR